jgi:RHS repeat-associated protein
LRSRFRALGDGAFSTNSIWDGQTLSVEYDDSGDVLNRYIHGPGEDNPLVWFVGGGMSAANPFNLITDRQYTVIGYSDQTGTVSSSSGVYSYDAYGAPNSWAGSRFRYTGQLAIAQAQLYYYKARVYDPVMGHFLQTDPVGYEDNLDLYEYVADDPTDRGDPSGEMAVDNEVGETQLNDNMGSSGFSNGNASTPPARSIVPPSEGGSGYSDKAPDRPEADQKRDYDPEYHKAMRDNQWMVWVALAPEFAVDAADLGVWAISRLEAKDGAKAGGDLLAKCCFAAGTLVETERGLEAIERIQVGDRVLSRDSATGVTAYKPVLALVRPHHRRIYDLTFEVGAHGARHRIVFKTTDDHPWRTVAGQWEPTAALTPRDEVIRAQGPPARVLSVRSTDRFESAYNLEVADFHTYFVGRDRLWVHNACSGLVKAARDLGFKLDKGFGRMHGQDVFKSGSRYITRDIDSHSGGVWKMFDRLGNRLGTFDKDLNRIGD